MSSNLPVVRQSYRGWGGKLEINIPPQQIRKGGLIIEGGVMSSEYSMYYMCSAHALIMALYTCS